MFEKLESFTKSVSSLPDEAVFNSAAEGKAAFDWAPEELRVTLNKLIDAIEKTEAGDSGAKNTGVSTISGLTGNDVQTILEQLTPKKLDPWGNLSTQNGWYHDASRPGQSFKDPWGMVHLRGVIMPGILTNGVTAFTLPEGYRPAREVDIIIKCFTSTNQLSYTTLSIKSNGNCSIHDNMSINSIRLDNIHFRTDS
ncbi:hypothetical protein V7150_19360 [Neobacillus drentensis]|uniref:hypothetical protein n=1 Tax=Neobacillus drentensis TaxID=220684 RepID=UPI002FFF7C45